MALAIVFDGVGFGEWSVLLAVILVVVGPKRLPATARKFGQYYAKFRRAADRFKRQLLDMDSELTNSVREAADEIEKAANGMSNVADELLSMPEPIQPSAAPSPAVPAAAAPEPPKPQPTESVDGN